MSADIIFALATGSARAGIAIVRLSGLGSGGVLEALTRRPLPKPRVASRRSVYSRRGDVIDDGLVLWFPAPGSFTGEDVVELHLHGGAAVVAGVLDELASSNGLRPAEPGEFTRRAFENGKLDLTAAEGVADLIDAETEAQRRQAFRQMKGALGGVYDSWRGRLLGVIGHMEAAIDFADEDLPEGLEREVFGEIDALRVEIKGHLEDGRRGERVRSGIRIAIIGPPNAGKSSLLNALARREAAIVSRHPGTTRDVIEVGLDLGGFPVVLADTAGIRQADGEIEEEGIRRARNEAKMADLKLAVFDGEKWPQTDRDTRELMDPDTIAVINKSDLLGLRPGLTVEGRETVVASALTGDGLEGLVESVKQWLMDRFAETAAPVLTRIRHREALGECHEALRRCEAGADAELIAEDLRLAARALGRITGRVDVEEVLDVIFRDFCIGK
jgi:tRNA modification GTPase